MSVYTESWHFLIQACVCQVHTIYRRYGRSPFFLSHDDTWYNVWEKFVPAKLSLIVNFLKEKRKSYIFTIPELKWRKSNERFVKTQRTTFSDRRLSKDGSFNEWDSEPRATQHRIADASAYCAFGKGQAGYLRKNVCSKAQPPSWSVTNVGAVYMRVTTIKCPKIQADIPCTIIMGGAEILQVERFHRPRNESTLVY